MHVFEKTDFFKIAKHEKNVRAEYIESNCEQ